LLRPQQTSLDRGLRLLALLRERGELRLSQIIEELGSSRATVFRALATLQAHGFVEHDRSGHVYRLGPALRDGPPPGIVRHSQAALEDLAERTRETAGLAVIQGRRITYAALVEGSYSVRFVAEAGAVIPAHASAAGKAVLAALGPDQRDLVLGSDPYAEFTPRTLVRRAPLEWDLEAVRERGYALDDQEMERGTRAVAVAVLDGGRRPLGAIMVAAPANRLGPSDVPKLGRAIDRWCDRIADRLLVGGSKGR
jgi:DNA-binding IclR family transcriptional regulator